jgi:RNA polymerase sigma-70 factor (ECF subfamily)
MTGEAAAGFEDLLAPVLARAYGTALHMTRNAADAEDLVQDAVLRALRGFSSFRTGTNFRAWFLRILTNSFYSTYRKHRREERDVALEEVPPVYLFQQSTTAGLDRLGDPVALTVGRLDADEVSTALDALPEEFRVVATLYFLDDLKYDEIAEVLDVPIGTVRSRLHRARRLLQKRLWNVALDHGLVPSKDVQRKERGL